MIKRLLTTSGTQSDADGDQPAGHLSYLLQRHLSAVPILGYFLLHERLGIPLWEWPQDLKDEYAYNPAKSRQLLTEAGYPKGFKTNIVADATGDINLLKIVQTTLLR